MHELNHQNGKGSRDRTTCLEKFRKNFPSTLALITPDGFIKVKPGRSRKTYKSNG